MTLRGGIASRSIHDPSRLKRRALHMATIGEGKAKDTDFQAGLHI